jgi:presenilin-like A22 family membrane protease
MIILAVLAIYDFLAVRFGYMVWMAKKMSETTSLPAIVVPYNPSGWNSTLKTSDFVVQEKPSDRKFAILGGGDIGFSLLLTASVYFASGLIPAVIIAGFSFLGLICAYWIQAVILKGKPMPALPPIAVMCLIGLLITLAL